MKFDLEHWVPLFFLCVVNKPPHEHDLCRWPRLDPLIVGVCAGVRASVCAGQVGAFSQLDARRPSPNPNPRPSQSQLPAITIQVRSRSQSYRYSSTHLRTLTARSPLGTPQNTCSLEIVNRITFTVWAYQIWPTTKILLLYYFLSTYAYSARSNVFSHPYPIFFRCMFVLRSNCC